MWTPIEFAPGIYKDDSPLKAQGYYIEADKIRFVNGLPETIYGWERASTSTLLGLCRGAFTWQDNSRNAWAAFGTHLRLYVMDLDGGVSDITPATEYSNPSMSLTTVDTETTVTITGWTHGLVVDQKFKLANPSTSTIGGITVAGTYVVLTVESATSITFTAASAATSSAGPTAITAEVTEYLAPGQEDGLAGAGFGTGGYGSGGYGGGSSAYDLFPRTWSFDQWGQNLLGSPRGDGIYEWAPNLSPSELVSNGSFSTLTGWSVGAGWSAGAGFASYTANGSTANLEQSITTSPGAWHLMTINVSAVAGTLTPIAGGFTVGAGITATGNYRRAFFAGSSTTVINMLKGTTAAGNLLDVSVQVLATAELIPGAPTVVGSMFTTAERIVVACGSNLDGDFDPLQVDWSDAEDNQTWTATSTNLAGGYTLPSGGRVVRGMRGARENLIWTADSIWSMRYNANPESVYDFTEMGTGCGLIGPNAVAIAGNTAYWMTPEGGFFAYNGGTPTMIPCTLARDVADNIAWVQGDKVYATHVVGKNYAEVWWFYPDSRDGNECSRYVIFDTIGLTWSCGTFDRTAYVHSAVFQYPIAVSSVGVPWFHEKDFTEDGGPRSWSITTAFNKSPGEDALIINGVKPDSDDLQGGYSITFKSKSRDVRGIFERTYPALNITASTGQRGIRVKGEQVQAVFSATAAPTFWRKGLDEYDAIGIPRSK